MSLIETKESGVVAKMWLHMLAEGGRWGVSELMELTGLQRKRADTILNQMAHREQVVKFSDTSRANGVAFGVTAKCRIPTHVRVIDMVVATAPQAESEAA